MGLPRGCRVLKLWAVLDCFPGPQAGSWKGSRAAGIRTGAHMGFWGCMLGEDLNHLRHRAGPTFFFLRFIFIIFYWKGGYTERRDREEDLPSDDSLPK